MRIKNYFASAFSIFCGSSGMANADMPGKTSKLYLPDPLLEYDLFEVSLPIERIVDREDDVLIYVGGQYNSEHVGFNLSIKNSLIPFLKINNDEIEPTNQGKWLENGCTFESTGRETEVLIEEILRLIHIDVPPNMIIKDKIIFETSLILGDIQDLSPYENSQKSGQEVFISPASTSGGENMFMNNLKLKVEFMNNLEPLCRIQLLISVDMRRKKLLIQEKDSEMRNGFIVTFYKLRR